MSVYKDGKQGDHGMLLSVIQTGWDSANRK